MELHAPSCLRRPLTMLSGNHLVQPRLPLSKDHPRLGVGQVKFSHGLIGDGTDHHVSEKRQS